MVKLSFHCKRLLLSRALHNECGFVFIEKVLTLVLNLTHASIINFVITSYGYVHFCVGFIYVCMRHITQLLTSWHVQINQRFLHMKIVILVL